MYVSSFFNRRVPASFCTSAILLVLAMLAGCASLSPPTTVISDATEAQLTKNFTDSLATVNASLEADALTKKASPIILLNFIDAGLALSDLQCQKYFKNLGIAARQHAFGQKELSLAGGTTAAIQGLLDTSAKTIAITSGLFSFANASGQNYAEAFLFSPDVSEVQEMVESARSAYRGALPPMDSLTYGRAVSLLRDYDRLCEVQSIRRLVNESVATANPVATKTTKTDAQAVFTPGERLLIAKAVGEPAITTTQGTLIYWLLYGAPSDDEKTTIAGGLKNLPLLVKANGELNTLAPTDQAKIKAAIAPAVERNEERLNASINALRGASGEDGNPAEEATPARTLSLPTTVKQSGISIKIRR